ncbi:MAG: hypothetical protein QNJ31_09150 [Candidatus Caenarcaniphilales bacterium]|nr:hypothetical protein [Candidatus Caenarcaniphilales bacterium]
MTRVSSVNFNIKKHVKRTFQSNNSSTSRLKRIMGNGYPKIFAFNKRFLFNNLRLIYLYSSLPVATGLFNIHPSLRNVLFPLHSTVSLGVIHKQLLEAKNARLLWMKEKFHNHQPSQIVNDILCRLGQLKIDKSSINKIFAN